jgi:TatD DNase family protein
MWIDSHCHLNHDRNSDGDTPADLVARAKASGVDGMVNINCRIVEEFPTILTTVKQFDNVWCTVGTHPHDAGLEAEKNVTLEELIGLAQSHDKIIGIGESGLDYFYDNSPRADQEESFRKHIRACIATDMPLIVHARDADADIIRVIRSENPNKKLRGVMHCFSSGPQLAIDALEEGFYISASGIVTFKKSTELQEIFKTVPLDRIIVETDAPFLAPMPHRGKTNEPAYVAHTGAFVAALKGVDTDAFARQTSDNFFTLFDKARLTWQAH